MVEYLTMKHSLIFIMIALFGLMSSVQAEVLKDPTLAPVNLYGEANSVDADGQALPSGPVLQSIMIGAQYRAAIINGQKIVLGKKYEQATLIKVTENEAVLRSPDGTTQTLSMGKVDKKMSAPDAPTKTIPAKNTNVKQASKTGSPDQSK